MTVIKLFKAFNFTCKVMFAQDLSPCDIVLVLEGFFTKMSENNIFTGGEENLRKSCESNNLNFSFSGVLSIIH